MTSQVLGLAVVETLENRRLLSGSHDYIWKEAENFDGTQLAADLHRWDAFSYAGFNGSGVRAMENDKGKYEFSGAVSSAMLDYTANFAQAGKYYVWVRGIGFDGNSDSVHLGLNGTPQISAGNIAVRREGVLWSTFSTENSLAGFMMIPSAGEHTINLFMREAGTSVDQIFLTTDKAFKPANAPAVPAVTIATNTPTSGTTAEGDANGVTYTFTRSSGAGENTLTVTGSVIGGDASADDYTLVGDGVTYNAANATFSIEFGINDVQKQITVKANTDAEIEGEEYVVLELDEPTGSAPAYLLGGSTQVNTTIGDRTAILDSLTIKDPANPSNYVMNAGGDESIFYIEEGADHKAMIRVSGLVSPDTAVAKAKTLWRIDEPNASIAQGDFSGSSNNVELTIVADARTWTVKAGVDENGNGNLDAGEVTRTVAVQLVKVESLKVTDSISGHSVTNPSNAELVVVEDPILGGAKIKLHADYKPATDSEAGGHILWDVLGGTISGTTPGSFGSGGPEVTLTPGAGSRVYDVKIGFDNNADGSLQLEEIDRLVTVYVVKADVKSITFGETYTNRFFPITADNGVLYTGAQWQDNSATSDRDADDAGDSKQPLAYLRGATMKLDASFEIDLPAGMVPDSNWIVKGDGPASYDFYRKWGVDDPADLSDSMHVVGGTLYMSNEAAAAFPNWIDHFDTFDIAWTMSFDNGATWHDVGTTKNQVYTLLEKPAANVTLFHTLAHFTTRPTVGKGLSTEASLVAAIYGDFRDQIINRADGHQLTYWGTASTTATNTAALLLDGDGQCGSWAEFLIDSFRVHGISSAKKIYVEGKAKSDVGVELEPGESRSLMLIKKWNFAPAGTAPAAVAPFTHRSGEFTPGARVAAQGNNASPEAFFNHFIVEYGGQYYDPSYGPPIFATHAAWEDASLAGVAAGKVYINPVTGLPVADIFAKANTVGDEETDFIEVPMSY